MYSNLFVVTFEMISRGFLRGLALEKLIGVKMILPGLFDYVEESSYKDIQLKKFCLPVKTSCPPAKHVNETLRFPPPHLLLVLAGDIVF